MSKGQDIVPATKGNITLEQVEDVLLHGGEVEVVSSDEVQADMVRRILEAGTVEDAFNNFQSVSASDIEGVEVEVRGIAWMRSAFNEGPKVYALLDCVNIETGEAITVSMGGRSLMASFLWAQRNRAMPFRGEFVKERSRTNTERAYWLFKLA